MKREVILLVFGLLLIVVMVGGVSAECQYKDYIESNKSVSNLYVNETKQINVLEIRSTSCSYNTFTGLGSCSFEVFNNIDFPVNVRVEFSQGTSTSFENIIIPAHQFTGISRSFTSPSSYIQFNTIEFKFQTNNYTEARWEKEMIEFCKQCLNKDCLNDGEDCLYDFECGSNVCSNSGNTAGHCISERSDFEKRVLDLESWQQVINNNLTNIFNILITQTTKINSFESRLIALESKNCTCQAPSTESFPNYFKYLSSSDRKSMVCGYAQDNHLTSITDLGFNCTIIYKVNQYTKKETPSCRCIGK